MNSKRMRSGAIYALLVLALGAFLYTSLVGRTSPVAADMPVGDVAALVRSGDIKSIEVDNEKLLIRKTTGEPLQSRIEPDTGLLETLNSLGVTTDQISQVEISVSTPQFWDTWSNVLIALIPLALLAAFFASGRLSVTCSTAPSRRTCR